MAELRNVVIMGSGCAGLTAAIYAARANLKPLVLEGHEPGGQLSMTTLVENFPGFPDGIQGPELIENMRKQAERFGTEFRTAHVHSAHLSSRPFTLSLGKEEIKTRTLIIASGASARWLGLPSEQALIGHGVSSCATCDGFFFSGKDISVIGGGDSAMEEALFLTRFATKVSLIHRRDSFRAEKILQDRLFAHPNIKIVWDSEVAEFVGGGMPEALVGLDVRNVKTGAITRIDVDGAFVAIGHKPATELFEGKLKLDSDGYIEVETGTTRTSVPGVFACGDVMDKIYRQAVTAAGTGCMAALDAEKYLAAMEFEAIAAE